MSMLQMKYLHKKQEYLPPRYNTLMGTSETRRKIFNILNFVSLCLGGEKTLLVLARMG